MQRTIINRILGQRYDFGLRGDCISQFEIINIVHFIIINIRLTIKHTQSYNGI